MSDWAAKVLAGVPRYDPFWNRLVMITAKDGDYVEYDDALAALAKLGAGGGLVEAGRSADTMRKMAEVLPMGSAIRIAAFAAADTITDLLAHIAALMAERDEARAERNKLETDLATVPAREANTFIRHDAKMEAAEAEAADLRARVARLEGAQRRIRKLPDHIEEQVKVTRDYAADCGMNPSQITLMDICTSHFLDMARELRAAITDGGNDG